MKTVKIKIEGLDALQDKIKAMPEAVRKAAENALQIVATDLWGKAAERAPVDTGDLRGSGFAVVGNKTVGEMEEDTNPKSVRGDIPKVSGLNAVVGFAEPYALRQHEDMELNHPQAIGVYGRAKYLEIPYEENRDRYVDDVGKAIKEAVEQ